MKPITITLDPKKLTLPKWAAAPGLLLVLSSFFLHPNKCVSGADIISKIISPENQPAAQGTLIGIGTVVLMLAKSILHSEEEEQPNVSTQPK